MEKSISVEERIRRAEEIYLRRKNLNDTQNRTQKLPINDNKKDIKLLKKMIMQILICIFIYFLIYTIQNSGSIFSENIINKTREILAYDTNFAEIYETVKNAIITFNQNIQGNEKQEEQPKVEEQQNEITEEEQKVQEVKEVQNQEAIGGAEEGQTEMPLTQEEQDIQNVKNTTTFIKPISGTITSSYGYRETATGTVPKNHTGTDIGANLGTKIYSSTEGEVVLASEEGDYGKHLKIQIGEVSIIYAHCNNLYVKQGDHVTQGQEIAEVGSTGNSTGPHLHFEIRYQERTVNAQNILDL